MLEEIKALIKHTAIYGLGAILAKVVGFLLIPLYTHYLTPADYGVLELLDLTVTVLGMFINMGITASIFRFYYHYDDPRDKAQVVGTALIFIVAASLLTVGTCMLFAPCLSTVIFGSAGYAHYLRLMLLSFFFSTVGIVPETYLMARQRSALFTAINVGTLLFNVLLNIYAVAILKMGVLGILYVSVLMRFLNNTFTLCLVLRDVSLSVSLNKLREMLSYGLPLVPVSLGMFVLNSADRFFLRHFASLSEVGIYSLGFKFAFMISFLLVQPFNRIWSARMFEIARRPDAREVYARLFTYFCFVLVFAALVMSLFIDEVLRLVSAPSFWAASVVVPLLAFSYVVRGSYYFFQVGICLERKTRYLGQTVGLAALLHLLFDYLLIRSFGTMGAALASLLSSALMGAVVLTFSQRFYFINYEFSRLFRMLAAAASVFLAAQFIKLTYPQASLWFSLCFKALFVFVFLLLLFPLNFYTREEITWLKSLSQSPMRRYHVAK